MDTISRPENACLIFVRKTFPLPSLIFPTHHPMQVAQPVVTGVMPPSTQPPPPQPQQRPRTPYLQMFQERLRQQKSAPDGVVGVRPGGPDSAVAGLRPMVSPTASPHVSSSSAAAVEGGVAQRPPLQHAMSVPASAPVRIIVLSCPEQDIKRHLKGHLTSKYPLCKALSHYFRILSQC